MTANTPTLLALDFDGVICDGLIEYFQTAWRTYCQMWSPPSPTPPDDLASRFYRLRPVIETGWEMPILIEALLQDIPEAKISQDWAAVAQQLLKQSGFAAADISQKLDQIRDESIANDLAGWLSLHRFYDGVVGKLRSILASPVRLLIITTKEGRFVQQLLQQQGVQMSQDCILGKESKRPKPQILKELTVQVPPNSPLSLWFVEDRLKTLQAVQQQSDLNAVKLYLADWGYNTPSEQESIRHDPRIKLLSLSQFARDFPAWP